MKRKHNMILTYCIILSSVIAGCDSSSESTDTTGTFNVRITDAPAAFEAVNITFSEISVNQSGGSAIVVSDSTQTIKSCFLLLTATSTNLLFMPVSALLYQKLAPD